VTASAYDAVADWYEQCATWPSALLHFGRELLPDQIAGQRVLDAACGHGRLSRELLDEGADVVGVDVSGELIEKARSLSADTGSQFSYLNADLARVDDWWDGTTATPTASGSDSAPITEPLRRT
jgi:2-polyprenyl-3-methyl-5-hydroxy-6-metoxy-1,4-benzoquinol methylase